MARSDTHGSTLGRGVYESVNRLKARSVSWVLICSLDEFRSAEARRKKSTTRPQRPRARAVAASRASRVPSRDVAMTWTVPPFAVASRSIGRFVAPIAVLDGQLRDQQLSPPEKGGK